MSGLFTLETLGALPHLAFFAVAGWCVYSYVGPSGGLLWALIAVAAMTLVKAVVISYSVDLDLASVAIIFANYVLPLTFGIFGAFFASWRRSTWH